MKMNYEGRQRKELAAAIAEITGEKAVYMKAPTYAYQIGIFTVERNGDLICGDEAALEELLPGLAEKGFTAEPEPQEDSINADDSGPTVTVPATVVSIDNLNNLLEAKGALIRKALGVTDIRVEEVIWLGDETLEEAAAAEKEIHVKVRSARAPAVWPAGSTRVPTSSTEP